MDLINILQCNKELIELLQVRPQGALPSIAWEGRMIYLGSGKMVVNLEELAPEKKLEQLKALYPDLGTFELLRLHAVFQFPMQALCAYLHVPVKEENETFFGELIHLFPRVVQDHFDERKVKMSELSFLRAWKGTLTPNQRKATAQISKFDLSLQNSLKALETMMDLFLMEKPLERILAASNEAELNKALFQERYPVSQQIQNSKEKQMSQIHWPSFAKAKVTRRGDRTGYEVQSFIASEADLTKMIATMERLKEQFQIVKEPSDS